MIAGFDNKTILLLLGARHNFCVKRGYITTQLVTNNLSLPEITLLMFLLDVQCLPIGFSQLLVLSRLKH